MISAELCYRNYVPKNYHSFEVSHVRFHGNSDTIKILYDLMHIIEFDKSHEQRTKIRQLLKHKQANYTERQNWQKEIQYFKKCHLFWMLNKRLREEKAILRIECEKFDKIDEHLSQAILQLEKNKFYNASELTPKFKDTLTQLGFTCKTSTKNHSNLHTENYESTCSDEELIAKAKQLIAQLRHEQKQKLSALAERYSQHDVIDSKDILNLD